jgi:hypothetical protein
MRCGKDTHQAAYKLVETPGVISNNGGKYSLKQL